MYLTENQPTYLFITYLLSLFFLPFYFKFSNGQELGGVDYIKKASLYYFIIESFFLGFVLFLIVGKDIM